MSLFSRIKNAMIGRGSTVTVPLISEDIELDERIADLETELEAVQAALKVESDENDRLVKELLEAERAVIYLNSIQNATAFGLMPKPMEQTIVRIIARHEQRPKARQ